MTSPDPRYRIALPEFPLFELTFGEDEPAGTTTAEEAPVEAAEPAESVVELAQTPAPDAAHTASELSAPDVPGNGAAEPAAVSVDEPERDRPAVLEGTAPYAVRDEAEAPALDMDVEVAQIVVEAEAALLEAAVLPEWVEAVAVFDLETTGIDTDTARIVSAHVGVLDDEGVVVERKDWLIDPGVEIPDGAAAVHGISTARARRYGRPASEVIAEILDAIRSVERRGLPLVVYNAPYDLTLLTREAQRHDLEPLDGTGRVIDPLVLDKGLDRYRKGKRTLQVTAGVYGVELTDAHDAGADAIAAGRVAQAMAARYPVELGVELERLHAMQVEWCRDQAASFEEYMRRVKDPSFTTSGLWPSR